MCLILKAEEGVEQLAWGMTKILAGLKGKVVEIGIYATFKYPALNQTSHINVCTDSTNSKNLELYNIMAEHDIAGFPLTYCLLLTATALHVQKRQKALHAWASCLREKYGITPRFMHTDKDMVEIGILCVIHGS